MTGMRLLLVDATNVVMRCASVPDMDPQEAVQTADVTRIIERKSA